MTREKIEKLIADHKEGLEEYRDQYLKRETLSEIIARRKRAERDARLVQIITR